MVICTNCGSENPDSSKFCVSCGNQLSKQSSYQPKPQQKVVSPTMSQPRGAGQCLWCKQSVGYKEEEGKLDSKWGVTAHKMKIYICNNCGYAHLFGLGRTIWDFD